MKLAYSTCIWNHHQGPVCEELARILGDESFRMLLHRPLDNKWSVARMKLGWNLVPPDRKWIVGPPGTAEGADYSEQEKCALDADVLVFAGDEPFITHKLLLKRRRQGKINVMMGERFFKHPRPWHYAINPIRQLARIRRGLEFWLERMFFLTMGHWCADDIAYFYVRKGRIWRWGYLTSTSDSYPERPHREKVRIGWCGRMLYWKNVPTLIEAVSRLMEDVRNKVEVEIVGEGEALAAWQGLAKSLGVEKTIDVKPAVSADEAKRFMRSLDIYVFPSGRYEGWGAALLEAMDAGCAVVASKSAGSTLEVVEDGVNGFVFDEGDSASLSKHISWLVGHEDKRRQMGRKAWETIQRWSPREGALRLVELAKGLSGGDLSHAPKDGLCAMVR